MKAKQSKKARKLFQNESIGRKILKAICNRKEKVLLGNKKIYIRQL